MSSAVNFRWDTVAGVNLITVFNEKTVIFVADEVLHEAQLMSQTHFRAVAGRHIRSPLLSWK
jgi:hypothetical protein